VTPEAETFASQNISFFRWFSALAVVVMHATALLLAQSDIMSAPHNVFEYFWWFVSNKEVGHKAVVGFFVISGYLVGGEVIRGLNREGAFFGSYLLKRFARIYVVLVPALFFTALIDAIGSHFFARGGFYNEGMFSGHFGLKVFLANLFSLQDIVAEPYGTNIPLWTLALEVWYYVTFPLLLLPLLLRPATRVNIALFAAAVALCLYFSLVSYFFFWGYVIWILGAATTLLRRPFIRSYWLSLALLILLIVPVRLLVRGPLVEQFPSARTASDVLCALAFANLLLTARFSWPSLLRGLPALAPQMPNFTYSLYLTHLPLIVFVRAGLETVAPGWALQNATLGNWLAMFFAIGAAIAFAYAFSMRTETKTAAFRMRLAGTVEVLRDRGGRLLSRV
jgi:peptidoglycan/LPS O-acetylase OafA/YrhL